MFGPPQQPTPLFEPPGARTRRTLHDRIVETLRYLSDEIDTRRVGGLGEAQAAGYLAGRLRRAEFAAAVQSFRADVGEHVPLFALTVLATLLALGAAWLDLRPLAVGVALLLGAVLTLIIAEVEGSQPLRHLLRGKPSQSVIAGRAASSGAAQWRVIVLTPLDGPARPALSRRGLAVLLTTIVIASASSLAFAITAGPLWQWVLMICTLVLLAVCLWITRRRRVPALLPAIHGAGDLASLLMIAEELEPLPTIEVWMVALGGSSAGHESIRALLDRYPFAPADTCIIDLHRISTGQPVFVTRAGMLRERRSDRLLLALAADADAADITIDAEPRRLRQRTLAQALLRRGFRVLTVSSHSDTAPFASPDAATIERCVRFVLGIVRGLEGQKREA